MTKQDDIKKKIGTRRIYKYLEEDQGKAMNVHIHDRNLSINEFVKDLRGLVSQKDFWHGVKPIKETILKYK